MVYTITIKNPTQPDLQYQTQQKSNATVADLQSHLHADYPSHPSPSSQRLIYNGRLLTVNERMNEIFDEDENGEKIVHLAVRSRTGENDVKKEETTNTVTEEKNEPVERTQKVESPKSTVDETKSSENPAVTVNSTQSTPSNSTSPPLPFLPFASSYPYYNPYAPYYSYPYLPSAYNPFAAYDLLQQYPEGLRQRHTTTNTQQLQQQQAAMQQAQLLQQQYAQYYAQYMAMYAAQSGYQLPGSAAIPPSLVPPIVAPIVSSSLPSSSTVPLPVPPPINTSTTPHTASVTPSTGIAAFFGRSTPTPNTAAVGVPSTTPAATTPVQQPAVVPPVVNPAVPTQQQATPAVRPGVFQRARRYVDIKLIIKLGVLITLFSQDGDMQRTVLLVIASIIAYLYQVGAFRRGGPAPANNNNNNAAPVGAGGFGGVGAAVADDDDDGFAEQQAQLRELLRREEEERQIRQGIVSDNTYVIDFALFLCAFLSLLTNCLFCSCSFCAL